MDILLAKIGMLIIAPFLLIGSFFGTPPLEPEGFPYDPNLGAFNTVAGQAYFLFGGGVSASQTTITLTDFDIPVAGIPLQTSDFGDIGYLTLEPGSTARQEIVSFTGVTQNADDSATLTGVTRGLSPITPYTASTTLQKAHPGGSIAVLSNPPQFYEEFATLQNSETITGAWTITVTPTADNSVANKKYVDDNVAGGVVSHDTVIEAATAGETITDGQVVYFDTIQTEWMLADASVAASSTQVRIGLAQGSGSNGAAITGGVITWGLATTTGLTAGNTIFISDTTGATSTSAGTNVHAIAVARSTTEMHFAPRFQEIVSSTDIAFTGANTFAGISTFSASSTFNATTTISATSTALIGDFAAYEIGKHVQIFTSDGDFARPSGINTVKVIVVGGGGGGGNANADGEGSGGGGAGGTSIESVDISATSTIGITIGAGGAGGTSGGAGAAGGTTTFGTGAAFLSATGGGGGAAGVVDNVGSDGGAGGAGSGGDVNITGGDGGDGGGTTTSNGIGGMGGSSTHGGGGGNGMQNASGTGGNLYGGGGGGSGANSSSERDGGAGAAGIVIVTW